MKIHVIGVPMDLGAGRRGVDMGPSALRIAGIDDKLRDLGYAVIEEGDIPIKVPEKQKIKNDQLKYLDEIVRACTTLCRKVDRVMDKGGFPLVLGGDHSIALGTISGLAVYARKTRKSLGVLWIDAHGDLNTDKTSPSGNIHGMPLAALIGLGNSSLTSVGGAFRKLDPRNVTLIATRDLDSAEQHHIRSLGVNIFTMEDIDKHGMAAVVRRALKKLTNIDCLHVSLDLDAVDPSVAPGVGTPVRGGLNFRESHLLMESIHVSGKLTSLEVVEVNPILDSRNKSAEFAVELVQSLCGKRII